MKLFIDVDGVLLGKSNGAIAFAEGAEDFLDYVIEHFDCYWLTTHCKGDEQTVLDYLRPFITSTVLAKLAIVKATNFNVLKTEVLTGETDFIWIEDQLLQAEFNWLDENNKLDCWYQVNTYKNSGDLGNCLELLKSFLADKE